MKIKKTPQSQRGIYKLYDDNGNLVTTYKPGENGVTEVIIAELHKMDDHEVYENAKEMKLPKWYQPFYDEWKEKFIADFEAKHGRKPFNDEIPGGHRVLESIDFMTDDDKDSVADRSRLQAELAETNEEDIPEAVLRLRELIAEMPERWQSVYRLVLIAGISKAEAGRILNISDVRVGQIVKQINKKISEDEKLKKFYK